nr:MAG TPA: Photosystem II protein D1 1 II, Time resolved, Free [Caudoviricetes sp.]
MHSFLVVPKIFLVDFYIQKNTGSSLVFFAF